jgi:streptogramin lyase
MTDVPKPTRRTVLKGAAASLVGATAFAMTGAAGDGGNDDWTAVETPTGNTLYDVETTSDGVYAVGGGGVVLHRTDEGWRTVLDGGPTGNGNDLYGADVTDDGSRLWFVGSSGAIGEYDVSSGVLSDHSAPNDVTNNFNDVSVTGRGDEANVYVAGDSGKIHYSFENGETGTWDSVTPGSGSEINAIDFHDSKSGHAVDGNQTVFVTGDGTSWDELGIADANYNLYGVDSDAADDVTVSGGGGTVYAWNGSEWTRADTGDAGLRDVEVDGDGLTVGGGGAVFRLDGEWTGESTPTGANLKAVVQADPAVAVGASGTVIEYH